MGALAAATAMAVSGSLVLFSLRRFAKHALDGGDEAAPASSLRPCLSSSGMYVAADSRCLLFFFLSARDSLLTVLSWILGVNREAAARAEGGEAGAVRGGRRGQ
jgi:hypothetical protein